MTQTVSTPTVDAMPTNEATWRAPQPLVSVIMPAYNSEAFIQDSIRSVLGQTLGSLELIVVDDHSTDGTVRAVLEAADDARLVLFQLPVNQGPAAARNFAIEAARGRYIAFLDADDLWTATKLEAQIADMVRNEWAFSYTAYTLIDDAGRQMSRSGRMRADVSHRRLLGGCVIQNSTAIYDTWRTDGKVYCPALRRRQDFGLFLRVLRRTECAHLSQSGGYSCAYRQMPGTVSSRKLGNIRYQWQIYRREENLNVTASAAYLTLWFRYAFAKNLRRRLGGGGPDGVEVAARGETARQAAADHGMSVASILRPVERAA